MIVLFCLYSCQFYVNFLFRLSSFDTRTRLNSTGAGPEAAGAGVEDIPVNENSSRPGALNPSRIHDNSTGAFSVSQTTSQDLNNALSESDNVNELLGDNVTDERD